MSNNDIVLAIVLAQVSIVALCFFYFLVQNISITVRFSLKEYKSEPPGAVGVMSDIEKTLEEGEK